MSVKFKTKIFAQSLTVVSHSLLQNHMEMLAIQAILSDTYIFGFLEILKNLR